MRFNKEKELSIIEDYKNGLNTIVIAKKWNTYNTSIRRVLLRYGITPRTIYEVNSKVKECPFKDNDEKSEYFLGLLLTDGCITRRSKHSATISLALKDKEMVQQFQDFICPQNNISEIVQKKYNTVMYQSSTRSKIVADWLDSKGNFYNKSYDCDIYIPLTPHILRGIFDGDGYCMKRNNDTTFCYGICGKSKKFLLKIQDYLKEHSIDFTIYYRHNLYYLESGKTINVLKFYNLIYKEAHIYLIRKYEKGHLFMETLREKFAKFKERDASLNPEPSHNSIGYLINKKNGQYIMEGAETIMQILNSIEHG